MTTKERIDEYRNQLINARAEIYLKTQEVEKLKEDELVLSGYIRALEEELRCEEDSVEEEESTPDENEEKYL